MIFFFSIYILFIKTQLTYYDVTQVRSLKWVNDDSKLVTSGIDGAVYEWGVQTGKRVNESVLKSCQYTCHAVSPQGKHTYAVGSDKTIKEITESSVSWELDQLLMFEKLELCKYCFYVQLQSGASRGVLHCRNCTTLKFCKKEFQYL